MPKKILFIEDDSLIVKIYTTRLSCEGYEVIWAEDGEEGCVKFASEQPDMVVLDLMIPKVSGLEVLKKIRQQNKKVPILVYTILSDGSVIKQTKAGGANEYLVKSETNPRQLVERIKSYFT